VTESIDRCADGRAKTGAAVRGIEEGTLLYIEVQPGSDRPGRLCYDEWRKRIRLSVGARAQGGQANEAVVRMLAGFLGVPAGTLRIASGRTDRRKTVVVSGQSPDEVLRRLGPHLEKAKDQGKRAGRGIGVGR